MGGFWPSTVNESALIFNLILMSFFVVFCLFFVKLNWTASFLDLNTALFSLTNQLLAFT